MVREVSGADWGEVDRAGMGAQSLACGAGGKPVCKGMAVLSAEAPARDWQGQDPMGPWRPFLRNLIFAQLQKKPWEG